jgi:hypothetical protein
MFKRVSNPVTGRLASCLMIYSSSLLVALPVFGAEARDQEVTAFIGAAILSGEQFVETDLCTSSGVFVACPDTPDRIVQLDGQFITPPMGDAHTHHFDGPYTLDWHRSLSLESGVFYAMNMTAPSSEVLKIRDQLHGPASVDVSSSLGGITGPNSHPIEIYEALALGFASYEEQLANLETIRSSTLQADNAYFIVRNATEAAAKLELLLSKDPDHVKVYLRHSERYDENWGKWGPGGGVDPTLLPAIAEAVAAAGKNLAVATSSVEDFRRALEVGAHNVTHIPCYQDTESDPNSPYFDIAAENECLLTAADASAAARQGMSTTVVVTEWAKERPAKFVKWERQNIAMLQRQGASLVLAVEAYGSAITEGLIAGVEKGIVSARDAITMATVRTPKMIFPSRKIGCLDVGCEASFIAFSRNPIEDITAVRDISYLYKDGEQLEL